MSESIETKFSISASTLMRAVQNKIAGFSNIKSGTYDRADPTAYCHMITYLTFEHDPWSLKWLQRVVRDEGEGGPVGSIIPYPFQSCYELNWNDCTWGVEVDVRLRSHNCDLTNDEMSRQGQVIDRNVAKFYLDYLSGRLILRDDTPMKRVEEVLLYILCGDCELSRDITTFETSDEQGRG